jgi:TolB protein
MKEFKMKRLSIGLMSLALIMPAVTKAQFFGRTDEARVRITDAHFEPYPVAITFLADGAHTSVAQQMNQVIENDLRSSRFFNPLDPKAFIQTASSVETQGPRFADWRLINAQALVFANVQQGDNGYLRVSFRVFDVVLGKQIAGLMFQAPSQKWRELAHMIADSVYEWRMKAPGYFNTKIAYTAESGPAVRRVKRLMVMDQDGENLKQLTDGRMLVAMPEFCPTRSEVAYLGFAGNRIRVFIANYQTGQHQVLGDFPGMSIAPRYSPDGQDVVFSMVQNGQTNIFMMNLISKSVVRLSDSRGISTSPCFSPDGRHIVFESDRDGRLHLYVMNRDGTGVRKLTQGSARYANPVWGTHWIAFTKVEVGKGFTVGIVRPDGTDERHITSAGFHVEGVQWAPDGQTLLFFRQSPRDRRGQGGKANLYAMHISKIGGERLVPTTTDASDPAWSKSLTKR